MSTRSCRSAPAGLYNIGTSFCNNVANIHDIIVYRMEFDVRLGGPAHGIVIVHKTMPGSGGGEGGLEGGGGSNACLI